MKRIKRSQSDAAPDLLRVEFTGEVGPEILQTLHRTGLTDEVPQQLRDVIRAAGGKDLAGVYAMSSEEIAVDPYGFAREFKLTLQAGVSGEAAVEMLQQSPLVKSVRPIVLRRSS